MLMWTNCNVEMCVGNHGDDKVQTFFSRWHTWVRIQCFVTDINDLMELGLNYHGCYFSAILRMKWHFWNLSWLNLHGICTEFEPHTHTHTHIVLDDISRAMDISYTSVQSAFVEWVLNRCRFEVFFVAICDIRQSCRTCPWAPLGGQRHSCYMKYDFIASMNHVVYCFNALKINAFDNHW